MPTLENSCEDTIEFTIVYRATELQGGDSVARGLGAADTRLMVAQWPTLTWIGETTGNWHMGGGGGRQYVGQ